MSSSKRDRSGVFEGRLQAALSLPAHNVHLRSSGIEFLSRRRIADWTEVEVAIQPASTRARPIKCVGIVVGCHGTSRAGFVVSMAFIHLSKTSQDRLQALLG